MCGWVGLVLPQEPTPEEGSSNQMKLDVLLLLLATPRTHSHTFPVPAQNAPCCVSVFAARARSAAACNCTPRAQRGLSSLLPSSLPATHSRLRSGPHVVTP